MAAMRAALRALRDGSVPAAILRRRPRAAAPSKRLGGVRSMTNDAGAQEMSCCSCENEILQLRKDMLAEYQRIWKMYDGLLTVNHEMLSKMTSIEAQAAERQIVAVENMVKSSYRILAAGGAFMLGMFMVMSPLLKAAWQQETIEAMERKIRLRRVDAIITATGPAVNSAKTPMGPVSAKVGEETDPVDQAASAAQESDGAKSNLKAGEPASLVSPAHPDGAEGKKDSNGFCKESELVSGASSGDEKGAKAKPKAGEKGAKAKPKAGEASPGPKE